MNTLLRHLLTTPILVCGLGLLSLLKSPAASSGTVAIGSAANFSKPLQEIARRFEAQSGHTTRISHGSSGKLYAQIRQGAPYDVFLSADSDKPRRLSEAGFGAPDGPFTYAIGQLALWSPDPQRFAAQLPGASPAEALADEKRLAIANPRVAPYGQAAIAVLKKLNLWGQMESRLVYGENIAQTYQFVSTGNAGAGFVALSQVWFRGQWLTGSAWQVPASSHPPIRQDGLLLKRAKDNPAADAFVSYLNSAEVQTLLRDFGYDTPKRDEP